MSYLNGTRFNFSGRFLAKVSTVNNYPENFDPKIHGTIKGAQNWNPTGTGEWAISECAVTSAFVDDAPDNTLPNINVQSVDTPFKASIVDLDTQMQGCSELWAFKIFIGETEDTALMTGTYKVGPFTDIWFSRTPTLSGDSGAGAFFQSVLTDVVWSDNIPKGVLRELKQISYGNMLSIKFNTDLYLDKTIGNNETNCTGRVVGTIGPYFEGEPCHFINGRALHPFDTSSNCFAYSYIDENAKKLYIDLGNGFQNQYLKDDPADAVNGFPIDIGSLTLNAGVGSGAAPIGNIDYLGGDYTLTALIQSFDLTDDLLLTLRNTPMSITSDTKDSIWTEPSSGQYIRADQFVKRMQANDTASFDIYANLFGKPLANTPITLTPCPEDLWGYNGPPPLQTPGNALQQINSSTTDTAGKATVTLKSTPPGNPRKYIDGQVYGLRYFINSNMSSNSIKSNFLSIHVYDEHIVSEKPTYYKDVKPILDKYGWLYPVMGSYLDLSDYDSIYANKGQLEAVLFAQNKDGTPKKPGKDDGHNNNPIYMPVTRDLSEDKRLLLYNWLTADCPKGTPPTKP